MANDIDDFDDDLPADEEFSEVEFEATDAFKPNINWRRIEILKEQLLLKKQLDDFYSLPE